MKDQEDFLGWIHVDGSHNPKGMYHEYLSNFEQVASEQIALGNSINFWNSINELLLSVQSTFNPDDFNRLNNKAADAENKLANDNVINSSENIDDILFQYNLLTFFWNVRNTQSLVDPDLRNLSYTNRLPEITIPTLILWGKHDMIVPILFAEEAYDNLGSNIKELVIFERSGHVPMFSEAEKFTQEIISFINENK